MSFGLACTYVVASVFIALFNQRVFAMFWRHGQAEEKGVLRAEQGYIVHAVLGNCRLVQGVRRQVYDFASRNCGRYTNSEDREESIAYRGANTSSRTRSGSATTKPGREVLKNHRQEASRQHLLFPQGIPWPSTSQLKIHWW
ncbi:unnamed protein product [Sphacelaria rigidula]